MPEFDMQQDQQRGNGGSRPVPDPTVLTTEAIEREARRADNYVDGKNAVLIERLDGIDKATKLLNETVNRVPTDVQVAIGNQREIQDERFKSIEQQFRERDTRSERESRDNKVAVDAAFAAQKEAASEQNKSNTLAINKSEIATNETINKLAELFRTTTDGLKDNLDDQKQRVAALETNVAQRLAALEASLTDRLTRLETNSVVRGEVKQEGHASIASIAAIVATIVIVVNLVIYVLTTSGGGP